MNLKARFESVKLPQALAELKHANQFLKVFSLCSLVLSVLCVSLAILLLSKGPQIIALSPSATPLSVNEGPDPQMEVEAALRKYIATRYSWTPQDIKDRLSQAREFVHQSALSSFDRELSDVQKFAKDRNVSQRAYASEIKVDLSKRVARLKGDRVTVIQGLTAAGPLNLTLSFESGPRTKSNPWGIYIARERKE